MTTVGRSPQSQLDQRVPGDACPVHNACSAPLGPAPGPHQALAMELRPLLLARPGSGRAPGPPGRRSCCWLCLRLPPGGGRMGAPGLSFLWPPPQLWPCQINLQRAGQGSCGDVSGEQCEHRHPPPPPARRVCSPLVSFQPQALHLAVSAPVRSGRGPGASREGDLSHPGWAPQDMPPQG